MAYKGGAQSILIEFEVSGLTFEEYLKDKDKADWSTSSPETADYNLEIETDDRKPISKNGIIKVPTSKTLTLTLEGAFDKEIEADKHLHQNFLKYESGLIKITDYLSDEAKPQIYVGSFDRTGLSFPRSQETATYSYEGSAGEYINETDGAI